MGQSLEKLTNIFKMYVPRLFPTTVGTCYHLAQGTSDLDSHQIQLVSLGTCIFATEVLKNKDKLFHGLVGVAQAQLYVFFDTPQKLHPGDTIVHQNGTWVVFESSNFGCYSEVLVNAI